MNCPKCGKENQDGAQNCQFCNATFNGTIDSPKPVTIKVSRLAIIAVVCAIIAIMFLPYITRNSNPEETENYNIRTLTFLKIACYLNLSLLLTSAILGFISYILIEKSGGKVTGRNFAVGVILLSIIVGFFVVLSTSPFFVRRVAFRMVCGTNLSGIGKAMLIYANDYDDKFPRAGGSTTIWGTIVKWDATNRQMAFGLAGDGAGGVATISSSLYLLVKYAEVTPKSFLCAGEFRISEFKAKKNLDLKQLWDFGPEPWKHCSYSYHMPYCNYSITTSSEPGMAVMADRNPWIPSLGWKVKDISKFNPDGDRNAIKAGNSFPHKNEGQNVLFIDSHVEFENTPCYGVDEDNIYTYQNGEDIRRGSPPQIGSQPTNRADSMLVNDPPIQNP